MTSTKTTIFKYGITLDHEYTYTPPGGTETTETFHSVQDTKYDTYTDASSGTAVDVVKPYLDINTDTKSTFQSVAGNERTMKSSEAFNNINSLEANTKYITSSVVAQDQTLSTNYTNLDELTTLITDNVINALGDSSTTITNLNVANLTATNITVGASGDERDVENDFVRRTGGNTIDTSVSPNVDRSIEGKQRINIVYDTTNNYSTTYEFNGDASESGNTGFTITETKPTVGRMMSLLAPNSTAWNGLVFGNELSNYNSFVLGYVPNSSQYDRYAFITRYGDNTTNATKFYYDGIYAYSYRNSSDARLKENINLVSVADSERLIESLKVKSFRFKSDEKKRIKYGFIAQEVQELAPELVYDDGTEEHLLSIDYIGFIPHLVNVVQEQQKRIEKLESIVQQLIEQK